MSRWISILQLSAALLGVGCASPGRDQAILERYEQEEPQMGVPFRIVCYAESERTASNAISAAFTRIAQLNEIMSDYETDSELSVLSRSSEEGSPTVRLSADLWNVLSAAQQLARDSDGAFDVTVGPCSALWRKARREKELPDEPRLRLALSKVGYTNLVLNPAGKTARLLRHGMRLDLGGIAKGYAADEALKELKRHGIRRALVAASGDLAIGDAPPGKSGWTVAIAGHSSLTNRTEQFLTLSNCGVATSGDMFQRLEIDGVRYSHILDPFTCVGMTNQALATVIAEECMMADAIDTTLTILSQSEGESLAKRYGVAARVVRLEKDGLVQYTNKRFDRWVTASANRRAD